MQKLADISLFEEICSDSNTTIALFNNNGLGNTMRNLQRSRGAMKFRKWLAQILCVPLTTAGMYMCNNFADRLYDAYQNYNDRHNRVAVQEDDSLKQEFALKIAQEVLGNGTQQQSESPQSIRDDVYSLLNDAENSENITEQDVERISNRFVEMLEQFEAVREMHLMSTDNIIEAKHEIRDIKDRIMKLSERTNANKKPFQWD